MYLNVTEQQINDWMAGAFIQDVFPHLSANEREFLISGAMPDSWDKAYSMLEDIA